MDSDLNNISTVWSEIREAQEGTGPAADLARQRVLDRYERAIRRYLLGALHDTNAVQDLYQDFVCRFLNGSFRNANPDRGRFRAFLVTSLSHLVADYRRQRRRSPLQLMGDGPEVCPEAASEREFMSAWREELIRAAWEQLERFQKETGRPYFSLLRFKARHPRARSADLAGLLSREVQRAFTVNWVRKRLHEARRRFKIFFLDEVQRYLGDLSFEALEEELRWMEMLETCRGPLYERFGRRDPREALSETPVG